jgi:3-dehydroquinate synthase
MNVMTTDLLCVALGERAYDIAITSADPVGLGPFARARCKGTLALVVTDAGARGHGETAVRALEAAGFQAPLAVLPSGETQKSLRVAEGLYDRLVDHRADRRTLIVAVGGGVIGDLAGFVAATYNRGLPLLMVPTTLLAMVDSSVGGKVGVNHPRAKNLIGAFHQPIGVWIDTASLATLPEREYRSGLAEVVKYGVILDAAFFAWLEANVAPLLRREASAVRHVVGRCCRLKADVVEKDEREETGPRMALNYGHTCGHGIESTAGYGTLLHGEAVAIGMECAGRLAVRRGLMTTDFVQRQRNLLRAFGLPVVAARQAVDTVLAAMRSDKKNQAGRLRFILPRRLGEVALFDDVPESDVREVLNEVCVANG